MTKELTTQTAPATKLVKAKKRAIAEKAKASGWLMSACDKRAKLTNASIIYGIGGAAIMAIAVYFMFTGKWLTGLLVLFPSVSLLGFSVHYIDRPD